MTKFKVGDIAEFITKEGIYECGDVVEVIAAVGGLVNVKGKRGIFPVHSNCLILVARKLTKNQRITALEKEMSELRYFKKLAREMEDNSFHDLERITEMERRLESLEQKVELIKTLENRIGHLEQEIKQRLEVPNEPLITVEDKPKTPNQQRRESIEKAKEFVEKHGEGFLFDSVGNSIGAAKLEKIQDSVGYGSCIGYSQCHPSDVFNEHIGKAIALGRALGLDVSEFEQAVQPTEAVMGMAIQNYNGSVEVYSEILDNRLWVEYTNKKLEHYRKGTCKLTGFTARIIDDTNAQYRGDN